VVARRPELATWLPRAGGRQVIGWSPALLGAALSAADLVVDATPVGLGGDGEAAFVADLPLDRTGAGAVVASLVYHRDPLLLARARDAGRVVVDGRAMLVHQGARAFARWTGVDPPLDVMRAAVDRAIVDG
jgi:shikimate dehydrogenase